MNEQTRFDRDRMQNANIALASRASITTLDALQNFEPAVQAVALAVTFRLMAESLGVQPQDVFASVGQMMEHAENTGRTEFRSVKLYMEGEL
jgi:hypothetical protein